MYFKSAFLRLKFQFNLNLPVRRFLRQIFLRLKISNNIYDSKTQNGHKHCMFKRHNLLILIEHNSLNILITLFPELNLH